MKLDVFEYLHRETGLNTEMLAVQAADVERDWAVIEYLIKLGAGNASKAPRNTAEFVPCDGEGDGRPPRNVLEGERTAISGRMFTSRLIRGSAAAGCRIEDCHGEAAGIGDIGGQDTGIQL